MAKVEPSSKPQAENLPIGSFWESYRLGIISAVIVAQTVTIFVLLIILDLAKIITMSWVPLLVLTAAMSATISVVTILLLVRLLQPFRDVVRAVVYVSGKQVDARPPDPNDYEADRHGFKFILQSIFEVAANGKPKGGQKHDKMNEIIIEGANDMASGLAVLDKDRHVIYHNEKVPVSTDKDNFMTLDLIFPEGDTLDKWLDKVSKDKPFDERVWTRVADKLPGENDRHVFDIAASFHKGKPAETILTLFDRTDSYTPEEDDLEFISFAAHELRGPITVIRGYLDVIQDELGPKMAADQTELMRRLVVSANRLDSYVNNILNASRYDRRHLKLHLVEEKVKRIYDMISDDMKMRAQAQNRVLIVDMPDNLPTVAADANSVGEVMGNLIDNAIKYSNEGGLVHIAARAIPGFVEISVKDHGIGMPANVLANLFHKFYRSHRSRETVAGTGIGLYICKAIVSSHGGTITASSTENEGSTFSFTLPIYDTVAEQLKSDHGSNEKLITQESKGWIRNHSLYRG